MEIPEEKKLDGKKAAKNVEIGLQSRIEKLYSAHGAVPGLATVLVGNDYASGVYIESKKNSCKRGGICVDDHELPQSTTEGELTDLIYELNKKDNVHGILVQLPLPGHIKEEPIINAISSYKNVDGLDEKNLGKLVRAGDGFVPCTAKGIMGLLDSYEISVDDKHVVIIGRGILVGRPLSILMSTKGYDATAKGDHATVTLCNSRTHNLNTYTNIADIVVVAVNGNDYVLNGDMVRKGVVVVDAGIRRIPDPSGRKKYILVGHADADSLIDKVSFIIPVPGGVGPMTVAMLMENTVKAAEKYAYGRS